MKSSKQLIELLRKMDKDVIWFNENYDKIAEKYAGKVIAIEDQKIIAHADTVSELIKILESKGKDPRFMFIKAIPCKGAAYIL